MISLPRPDVAPSPGHILQRNGEAGLGGQGLQCWGRGCGGALGHGGRENRLKTEEQSCGFSQMLRMWSREPAVFCFTAGPFIHKNSSLPIFQPQIQHMLDMGAAWVTMRVFFLRVSHQSIRLRNRKSPKLGGPWRWVLKTSAFPLRHSLEGQLWTPRPHTLVLPSAPPALCSGSPHEANNSQLSSAFLGFSYLFRSQTQEPRSRDGTINPLNTKIKLDVSMRPQRKGPGSDLAIPPSSLQKSVVRKAVFPSMDTAYTFMTEIGCFYLHCIISINSIHSASQIIAGLQNTLSLGLNQSLLKIYCSPLPSYVCNVFTLQMFFKMHCLWICLTSARHVKI